MATTGQTDFLDLGLYQAGDYISYLGSFNDNMSKIDDFAKNTHATIGGLTEQQGATEADITKINSDISDLQSAQETITNKIADLPQLTSDVATLKVDNTANKVNISTLNTSVDNLTTMVNQDGTEISSLNDRITALENVKPSVSNPIYCKSFGQHVGGITTTTIHFPNIGIDDTNINKFKMIYTIFATYRRIINGENNDILINTPIATGSYVLSDKQPHRILDDTTTLALPASYLGIPEYEQDIYVLNITKDIAIGGYDTGNRSVVVQGNAQIFATSLLYGPDKTTPSFGGISSNPWTPTFQFHLELAKSV